MTMRFLFPPIDHRRPRVGSQQTDYYRSIAVGKIQTASGDYNEANPIFSNDGARYTADTDTWNQVGPNMAEPDKTNCYNALTSAYSALDSERIQIESAYEHIGTAQSLLQQGDNAGTDQQKIQFYNQAGQNADAAVNCCQAAGPPHTQFVGFISTAESILANYG